MKPLRSRTCLMFFLAAVMCFTASQGICALEDPVQPSSLPNRTVTGNPDADSNTPPDTGEAKSAEEATPAQESESTEDAGKQIPIVFQAEFPRTSGKDRVRVGGSQKVDPDETVAEMVTVFGSADMSGSATGDMVTVFGNSAMTGTVAGDMVTIFGDAEINGPVNGDAVVIFGSLKTGPQAVVNGECAVIFGKLDFKGIPGGSFKKEYVEVMPWLFSLKDYVTSGPLLGRMLPPGSLLAWIVVALHFILYFLIALVLPKPTTACVRQLEENPLLSFGVGVLTMILLAPLSFILVLTGVGIILVPLIGLAEMVFAILGKTAVLEYFGLLILRRRAPDNGNRPILSFLIGFALVTVLYMVPILGLLLWLLLRPFSLGAALLAVFRSVRKNGNGTSVPGIPIPPVPGPRPDVPLAPDSPGSVGTVPGGSEMQAISLSPVAAEADTLPRAGFWIRIGATLLDMLLLIWLLPLISGFFVGLVLAYHVAMWTWKGTTIGGIICRLKIIRLDGRPVDFAVALVRGLTAIFSAAALGLGFFWAGWTREKQSWHDMIAGTVIVRVPQSQSMI
jgi:uncharacterized RDD family membrane protein YckC